MSGQQYGHLVRRDAADGVRETARDTPTSGGGSSRTTPRMGSAGAGAGVTRAGDQLEVPGLDVKELEAGDQEAGQGGGVGEVDVQLEVRGEGAVLRPALLRGEPAELAQLQDRVLAHGPGAAQRRGADALRR